MQAQGGDARIIQQRHGNGGKPGLRLIARRHHIGQRQPALLHRHVDGNIRRLRHNRHATATGQRAMLVGPQGRAIERIDKAVAIGAQKRHIACSLDQGLLQGRAIGQFGRGL